MQAEVIHVVGRGALHLRAAGPDDVPLIRELAGRSWHAFYPGMISMPQIYYMLRQMYSPRKLLADMQEGAGYFIATWRNLPSPDNRQPTAENIGFLGYDPPQAGQPLMLQRLYLVPAFQGRGLGAAILTWLESNARFLGHQEIRLRVNKHNHRALKAYRRAGYRPIDALIEPIGEGHVMDDYVLQRQL